MKSNSKFGLWVLIPGFILAFAARMTQLCAGTDMTTGFLKHESFFMDFCFWGAVIISIAGAVAAAVLDRKNNAHYYRTPVSDITDGRAAAIGFALLVPALGALYEGYTKMNPGDSAVTVSPFVMWVDLLFGAAMVVVSFVILYKKEFKPGLGFAVVCGAGFYTLRGIGIFMERMAVTTVPEYLINCISVILAAVFFMQLAKLLSGNEGKRTREALAVSGTAAAVTILGNSFAALAALLFGPAEVSSRIVLYSSYADWLYQASYGDHAYYMSLVPAADAAAGVFIIVTLIVLFMKPKPVEVNAEETAETDGE